MVNGPNSSLNVIFNFHLHIDGLAQVEMALNNVLGDNSSQDGIGVAHDCTELQLHLV